MFECIKTNRNAIPIHQSLKSIKSLHSKNNAYQISANAPTGDHYSKNIQYLPITQGRGELESGLFGSSKTQEALKMKDFF